MQELGGWNNDANDFQYTWTNDATVLPAGSIVIIYGDGAGTGTFTTDGGGSTTWNGGLANPSMRTQDEVIYLYMANSVADDASTVFLNALATDGFGGANGDLPPTLTIGDNAIEFTGNPDILVYEGPNSCNGTQLECQQMISDTNNWVSEEPANPGNGPVEWPPANGSVVNSVLDFNGSLLPVELISFTGSLNKGAGGAQLKWTTATEINNLGFSIEKSLDGAEWDEIGFVNGHGTSKKIHHYTFMDDKLTISSYYRLRQVDFDGAFELSKSIFVSVVSSDAQTPVMISPNPIIEQAMITGLMDEIYDINIMNAEGRRILELEKVRLGEFEQYLNEILSQSQPALYLIRFENPGFKTVIRLLKQ